MLYFSSFLHSLVCHNRQHEAYTGKRPGDPSAKKEGSFWLQFRVQSAEPGDNDIPFLLWIFSWTLPIWRDSLSALLSWVVCVDTKGNRRWVYVSVSLSTVNSVSSHQLRSKRILPQFMNKTLLKVKAFSCSMQVIYFNALQIGTERKFLASVAVLK